MLPSSFRRAMPARGVPFTVVNQPPATTLSLCRAEDPTKSLALTGLILQFHLSVVFTTTKIIVPGVVAREIKLEQVNEAFDALDRGEVARQIIRFAQ